MATIPLSPVDTVRVTILMDNVTDPLLFPTQQVERITWLYHLAKPRAASAGARLEKGRHPERRPRSGGGMVKRDGGRRARDCRNGLAFFNQLPRLVSRPGLELRGAYPLQGEEESVVFFRSWS
jgi:hypothetical protein